MGKTRDHVKEIRDTKGAFHGKMGTIMDRSGTDIREAKGKGEKKRKDIPI